MAYGLPVSGAGVTNYIDRHVNPDSAYLALCGEFINDIVKFMQEVTPYSVATTIKGGSFGKGTAVKDGSDLDILFVVNDVKSVQELQKKIKQIKHDIHTAICCNSFGTHKLTPEQKAIRRQRKKDKPFKVSNIRRTPFTVSFTMSKTDGKNFDVDVLIIPNISTTEPAGKFSQTELTNIYHQMKMNPPQREYYGKCLSPIQVDFVKSQPEKVKRSIRFMKSWVKENKHKLPSYAVELLVIKAYEDYNRPEPGGITEEKLVKRAFEMLKNPNDLRVEWDKHYNLDDFGRPDKPYIMDPANPYHNLFRPKTEEYWRNYNERERVVVCEPELLSLQNEAQVAIERLSS